jgi:hypothetical protein
MSRAVDTLPAPAAPPQPPATQTRRIADITLAAPPEYDAERDFSESINECYRAVRERIAAGGPPWTPPAVPAPKPPPDDAAAP